MSRIVSVYVATSLAGSIAREDGGLDWLNEANKRVPEVEDLGFSAFLNSADVLIMGRRTFEQVLSFGKWPYGDKPVITLSSTEVEIPENLSQMCYVAGRNI